MTSLILNWLARVLVVLFFLGLAGSAIVVLITFFEDGQLLLEGDDQKIKSDETRQEVGSVAREDF